MSVSNREIDNFYDDVVGRISEPFTTIQLTKWLQGFGESNKYSKDLSGSSVNRWIRLGVIERCEGGFRFRKQR